MRLEKRMSILEVDQQNLRNDFSRMIGEFKALKWIAGSLWLPAVVGLMLEFYHLILGGK